MFQFFYGLICDTYTPLAISFAEAIHEASRSKHMITLGNKLGVLTSYPTMERIDYTLAARIIEAVGNHRVPVSPSILSGNIIHAAENNFDGKEGSHDTILMLF